MSDSKIIALGYNAANKTYIPIQVDLNGFINVHITDPVFRSPNVFKTTTFVAAGDTTIWTPAAGNRIRLMGYSISAAGATAAALSDLLKLTEGAAGTVIANYMIGFNSTPTGDTQIFVDYGNEGIVFAAIDVALVANLAQSLTSGAIAINAWGMESA